MSSTHLRKEDYAPIGDFLTISFERDLPDFSVRYKNMDADYLALFKKSIAEVRAAKAIESLFAIQTESTKKLYTHADDLAAELTFLKDYATQAKIDDKLVAKAIQELYDRNIEGGIQVFREILPYYQDNIDKLTSMPDGFLDKLTPFMEELEKQNAGQNMHKNNIKISASENKELRDKLYAYILEICRAGKIIYKNSPKKDEYTISKLLARVRAARQKNEEKPDNGNNEMSETRNK